MKVLEEKQKCTGCAACYNICPTKSIIMQEDLEGFRYPKINEETCISCGLCQKICPILNKLDSSDKLEEPIKIAAWSKNQGTRLDSTSGGIFSELANAIYEKKGYVVGAIYNNEWMVQHYISNNPEDITKIRSSKYLQSNINTIYKEIQEKLKKNDIVLMCGTPCQISGLYNFLQKKYDNLYTCDFICRGVNSPKIFKGYIQSLEKKYKSKVKKIKFKNKTYGWHNFSTKIDFVNGKTYIGGRYIDSYMVGYLKYSAFIRPSCYECKFKELPRVSDITLADFWGIEKIDKNLDNDTGTSLILLNSPKGKELFEKVKANVEYTEIRSKEIFTENICMNKSVEKTETREKVFEKIDELSYDELSKLYFPEPRGIEKIKIKLKNARIVNKYVKPIYKKIRREKNATKSI